MQTSGLRPFVAPPRRHELRGSLVWALALLLALSAVPALADILGPIRALATQGDLTGALRKLDEAQAADPRDVQLRFMRGVLLMDLQRDGEALAHFEQMSLEFPELPDPYNNLALLHARAQRLEPARAALETALRNDPTHRTARANLVQIHLLLAQRELRALALQGPLERPLQRQLETVRALLQESTPARKPG